MTCLCLFSPHYIFCPLYSFLPTSLHFLTLFCLFYFLMQPLPLLLPLSPCLYLVLFLLVLSLPYFLCLHLSRSLSSFRPLIFLISPSLFHSLPYSISFIYSAYLLRSLSLSNFQNSYSFSLPRFSSSFPLTSFLSLLLPFCNNPLHSFSCLPTYLSTSFSLTHSLN